jgi:hypothetical protein
LANIKLGRKGKPYIICHSTDKEKGFTIMVPLANYLKILWFQVMAVACLLTVEFKACGCASIFVIGNWDIDFFNFCHCQV